MCFLKTYYNGYVRRGSNGDDMKNSENIPKTKSDVKNTENITKTKSDDENEPKVDDYEGKINEHDDLGFKTQENEGLKLKVVELEAKIKEFEKLGPKQELIKQNTDLVTKNQRMKNFTTLKTMQITDLEIIKEKYKIECQNFAILIFLELCGGAQLNLLAKLLKFSSQGIRNLEKRN